ncbi:aldose-1-epimerase [Apiospora kogelbergensis]|uniref:aldose-1-epimerase n=1 Tax=Apiospora kogelbergensis TaxID=1337665 RepID=UPI003132024E
MEKAMLDLRMAFTFGLRIFTLTSSAIAALRSAWTRGSPFAAATALFPTDGEGKYIIRAEGIRMAFTNNGGALTNLWINNTYGEEIDIIMGLDQAQDYLAYPGNPYLNGAIGMLTTCPGMEGRYAGYISGAAFDMDGERYRVSPNAHNNTSIHNGGDHGWGRTILDIGSHTENSITFVLFDRSWNGFPGTAASCLTHTVTPYEWRIAFGVTPTKKAGPINMSQQAFFNLDGFKSNATRTIQDHTLHLPFSGLRFGADELGIPTGDILAGKQHGQHDFWSAASPIGERLRQRPGELQHCCHSEGGTCCGYDETFLVSRSQPWKKEDSPAAILSSPRSGITMELYTDQEALHVHTWNGATRVALKKSQGQGSVPLHGAISLEMQDWPDGLNHPEWRRYNKTIWGMDGLYTTFSTYRFSVDGRS